MYLAGINKREWYLSHWILLYNNFILPFYLFFIFYLYWKIVKISIFQKIFTSIITTIIFYTHCGIAPWKFSIQSMFVRENINTPDIIIFIFKVSKKNCKNFIFQFFYFYYYYYFLHALCKKSWKFSINVRNRKYQYSQYNNNYFYLY